MVDFRLYRVAFAPALLALVAVMFSLEGAPQALEPTVPPGAFEGDRAAATARQIAATAPQREPGSSGDAEVADLVAARFGEIPAGSVSTQSFEASYEGDDVALRNVFLTLPGDPERTIVVIAPRNSPRGPDAAGTAAATGVLVELASVLGVAGHEKTYLLASTPGDGASATGALELLDGLPGREAVEAVIVISQPGAATPRQPFVVSSSSAVSSAPVQLERTAALSVSAQVGEAARQTSPFGQLARLAFPSGLGSQAPLIAAGVHAVAISSAGERPPSPTEDASAPTVDAFGRAVQSTVGAVDAATEPLVRGATVHVEAADNLVPGWTLTVLALALIVPAAVASVDGCARAARRSQPALLAVGSAIGSALPFLGALATLYALALVGVIPRPGFPFDPGLHPFGARPGFAIGLIAAAGAGSALLLRRLRSPGAARGRRPSATTAIVAIGAVGAMGSLLIWLANPYLGLLIAPVAHVWLLALGRPGRRRAALTAAAVALAIAPVGLAAASVASQLGLGASAPWTFVVMIADGQIGAATAIPACLVAGALLGAIAASWGPRSAPART